jgi:hypothetical protein
MAEGSGRVPSGVGWRQAVTGSAATKEDIVRLRSRVFVVVGAVVCAGLGFFETAGATTSPPAIQTSNFVCSNGTCAIGPGGVGMPFAAGLIGTGGPPYYGPECNPYIMSLVGGSLPPGLRLGEPICEWEITGTPTKPGTYNFTVQIAPQPNNRGQSVGPDGTQQFSITIGTGTADRLLLTGASWSPFCRQNLQVRGFDVNNAATYTISVTSTGVKLANFTEATPNNGGDGSFLQNFHETINLNNLTVTDSLGGTATIPFTVSTRYC